MLSTDDLNRLYAELERRWPAPALDELDKTLYATEVRHLNTAGLMAVIAEIRRGEQFRPLPRRVGEIVDLLSDPADTLPPVQAQAYRQIEAPRAVRGKGDTIRALVDRARPEDDTDEGWRQIQKEQPGRFQFLKTVAMLVSRKDVKKRPDYQPGPSAASRRTLNRSLRAAGLAPSYDDELPCAADMLPPEEKAAADAELARIKELRESLVPKQADVFTSIYCVLHYEEWTPYLKIAAAIRDEEIHQQALDAALRILLKRGAVEMRSENKTSFWRRKVTQEETEQGEGNE